MENSILLLTIGLGFLWHGALIYWVAGLPRQLKKTSKNITESDTEKSFMLFWFDQYSWIGLLIIFIGILVEEFDAPILVGLIQTFIVSICSLVPALMFEEFILANILDQKIQILYAGVLSGGIAFVLQIYAQQNISPTPSAIIFSLEGVFAAVAAWIILSQILNLNNIIGCCLILAGVLFSQIIPELKKSQI